MMFSAISITRLYVILISWIATIYHLIRTRFFKTDITYRIIFLFSLHLTDETKVELQQALRCLYFHDTI